MPNNTGAERYPTLHPGNYVSGFVKNSKPTLNCDRH